MKIKLIYWTEAGLGRDTKYFIADQIEVCAVDYSAEAIKNINKKNWI